MIEGLITPFPIASLNIPFEYKLADIKNRIYYRNYDFETPLIISETQIRKLDKEPSNCMFLLPFAGSYYWCPIFDDLYRGKKNKVTINFTISMFKSIHPCATIEFKIGSKKYNTRQVKEIRIKRK